MKYSRRYDLPMRFVKIIDLTSAIGFVSASSFFVLTIWTDPIPRFVGQIFGGVFILSVLLALIPTSIGGQPRRIIPVGDRARSNTADGGDAGGEGSGAG